MPAAAAGSVVMLDDNTDAWAARMRMLGGARKSVDVQNLIIDGDAFGLAWSD